MWIYAPNKHANGIYANVRFVDGIGKTDDPKLFRWFESHGYTLSETLEEDAPVVKTEEKPSAKKAKKTEVEPVVEEDTSRPMPESLTSGNEQEIYGVPLTKVLLMNDSDLKALATANGLGTKVRRMTHRTALLKALGVNINE